MEETASEATSPYLSSQMVYDTMDDQIMHADPGNFQHHTNGVVWHSQANQYQLIQGEPSNASDQPRARGCRAKLNEAEIRERKRLRDAKYRQKQRVKLNELPAENKRLQEENSRLSAEKRHLEEENRKLTVENRHLEELVRGLQSRTMHPAENSQRQDSYIYRRNGRLDHQNAYVQEHHTVDSRNEEAIYMEQDPLLMCFDIEGAGLESGLEINDLLSLLSETEMNQNRGIAIHKSVSEHPESSLSGMCDGDVAMNKFLMKLDEDVPSNVDFKDFTGLEGEQRTVGRYIFPLPLIPTVDKINQVHGDVSATCRINPRSAGTIYVLFCATIKEMGDLKLEQVTEEKMLKWRDTIKDALFIKFDVSFAMEHLKKIARAYFGLKSHLWLQNIHKNISQLEAEVNNWKAKRAETYEGSKLCIGAAEEFHGVTVSAGLFP
ncbi:hypothetical protein DITRI_Ditri01bG0136400 [Diplodiscus trichospermus]